MTDLDRILPILEPPPDGLRQLRARLDRRRGPGPWLAAGGLVLTGVVALGLALRGSPPAPLAVDAGLAAWSGPAGPPVQVLPGSEGTVAIARVPVELVWYRVDSTERAP